MKKEYTYRALSLVVLALGIIFTLSGAMLQTLPLSSKSALLIFSCAFIIIGLVSFAVHHKKYMIINDLLKRNIPVIAQWTYAPNSSITLTKIINSEKMNTLATALLVLILSLIFSIIFAYSGGTHVLLLGYTFAVLCFLIFIIATRFITMYYNQLTKTETTVLFGEEYIYFLDDLYPLQKALYLVDHINIYIGEENFLIFEYGFYDIDEPPAYSLTLPIPAGKLNIAMHLKDYYRSILHTDENE